MMNWIKMMGNNGRERRSSGSEISSYNNHENGGGCGWGLVHIIKHHHWPHFMRRLTHHKRKRLVENRTNSISIDGMQELDKLIVEEETIELAPQKNNSIKSQMKAILAEEIYKVKGRHHQSSSKRDKISAAAINPKPREEPIASDGNFADYSKQETVDEHQKRPSKNNAPRQEKLDDTDELMKLKPVSTKKNVADSFLSHPKEYLDALNIISANEEFLVKVLHDPGSPLAHHFRNQQALNRKQGLAKSETFPQPSSSGGRVSKPSRFKQMPRAESGVKGMAEASHNPCLDSPKKQKNHGETRVVTKRFKDFKQKIKHMIRERRKEMHRVAMDAVIHKIPCDQKIKIDGNQLKNLETCDGQGKDSPGSGYESDCSAPSFGKNKRRLRHMTRASSLNESMDRYCQLYETSFNREIKHQTSFDGVRRMEVVPKHLTRIYSLPDLKSYLNPSEESSDDFSVGMATRGDVKRLIQMGRSFDEHTNEDFSKDQLQTDFPMECIVEEDPTEVIAINSATENEVTFTSTENNETTTLSIDDAMESIIEEDPIELTAINSATENEFVLTSTANNNEEKIQCSSDMNESEEAESETGPALLIDELVKQEEIPDKHLMCDISNLQVKAKDKAEFSYVKDILELSGFSGDGFLGTWHSDDQPLNPLVYEEAKGCLVFDPDCCGNESGGKCDHPLLFDLINEVLMEIYARSYSYYPFPLSHLSHISPMPTGQHVLREVWGLISWYLSLRNEVDQTLGQVVGSDLAKGGWWMSLQFDCECVGLELEDLIFEDLLEEIIWA